MSRSLVTGKHPKRPEGASKGGRPTLLTPELMDKICAPLRIGVRVPTAFALSDVGYDTLRDWVIKGHQAPESIYGELIKRVEKAIAEYELRDISVLETHAHGAPAEYEREVVRNPDGTVIMDGDKPVTQIARDGEGNPIIKRKAIQSDWRAAAERLRSRLPMFWNKGAIDLDAPLKLSEEEKSRDVSPTKETKTFKEVVAEVMKEIEEDC